MERTDEKLVTWLFETDAIKVSPKDKPFWYTSGTIGPYYINTHFLFGGEENANRLLDVIDNEKDNIYACPSRLLEIVNANYEKNYIYKSLITEMCGFIKNNIDLNEIGYISGGERRDWFFSLIAADILQKPHLTIYKNLSVVVSEKNKVEEINSINGSKVLHIADLITEASSYERAWIPAVKRINGDIKWSLAVVDRKQGGEEFLASVGVKPFTLIYIDDNLFKKALSIGLIDEEQYLMLVKYIAHPYDTMRNFLQAHPEFLKAALKDYGKVGERAKMCLNKNIYRLDVNDVNDFI